MMRVILITATVAALVAVAACNRGEENAASGNAGATATAAPDGPKTAYEARQDGFDEIGDSFKAINRELKGDSPSIETVQREAAALAEKARQVPGWFPAGSGPEADTRTRAKAELWANEQGFRQRAQTFIDASAAFNQAAQSGDVAAIRAALPALGDSCKQCHGRYRGPEK